MRTILMREARPGDVVYAVWNAGVNRATFVVERVDCRREAVTLWADRPDLFVHSENGGDTVVLEYRGDEAGLLAEVHQSSPGRAREGDGVMESQTFWLGLAVASTVGFIVGFVMTAAMRGGR